METTTQTTAQSTEGQAGAQSPITLSTRAVEMIKQTIAAQKLDGHSLRVGVVPGGCSGFSYDLDLVKEARQGDVTFVQDGVSIMMDPMSVQYLKGTEIDYVEDGMRAGFAFKNPNAKASCGCGSSFSA